jgi:hypothetical protein
LEANPMLKAEASQELAGVTPTVDEHGRWVYQVDDMVLVAAPGEPDNAFTGTRWPNGNVYYQFDPAVTTTDRAIWRDAAAAWSAAAALTFVESTGSGNYIYVKNSSGNSSYVGMIGGAQEMNIYNWNYKYIVAHEIGHALGLKHEQSRPDRDTYVVIYTSNIEAGKEGNFTRDSTAQTYGSYDFESVMHYPRNAFSRNGSNTIEPTPPYSSYLNVMGQRSYLSSLDLSGMAQRYGGGSSAPSNDNFAGRRVISGTQGNVTGTNVGATRESSEPSYLVSNGGKSVWYSWTASANGTATIDTQQSNFDTILAVYTGSGLSSLNVIATNDNTSTNSQSSVTFTATAGTVYQIAVDGRSGASGSIRVNWALTGVTSAPANNSFANRQVVSGSSGTVTGSNGGATKESGEPNHAGNFGGRSIWYSWTAPSTGLATFDTGQSNFDTLLAVYTGTSVSALTHVVSNDDSQEGLTSRVAFSATAGVIYKIAVDGYDGDSGSVGLRWTLTQSPANSNDNFANRQVISGVTGSVTGSNLGATKEAGEPNHAEFFGGASVWYSWTAPSSGMVVFDTHQSDFDTLLAVYSGNAVNSLTPIAGNDDDGESRQSRITFSAVAGTIYKIAVDGYNANTGTIQLHWVMSVPFPLPNGAVVGIQAMANGRFVVAENAGNSPLIANRTTVGPWEEFQVLDVGNGYIALRSLINGLYVCAENFGGSPLIANRTTVGTWEQFQAVDTGSGNFALIARANGKYVCADNAGSSSLIANRTGIGGWEQFRLVFFPSVKPVNVILGLQSASGKYVVAENAGGAALAANRDSLSGWEQFRLVDVGNGNVGLQSLINGRYVTAESAGANPLIANRTAIGPWEQFQLLDVGSGNVALRAMVNNRYVSTAAAGGILIANKLFVGPTEQFAVNVTLRSQANSQFVAAGQQPLIANRPSIGTNEQFQIVNTGDGFFGLKAKANGRYVCAEDAGQSPLIANRTAIGGWEQFQWIVGGNGNVALKALVNGMFVCAENAGQSPLIANRPSAGNWEQFR